VPDREFVDRGLARERTDLAWNRSGLAVIACIAVLLRWIWPLHGNDEVVILASISAGGVIWALALSVGRFASSRKTRERGPLSPWRARAITVATLALALAAFVLGFFSPS
jgi:uncharacterized membrane protein YidH (DUF202 family)